VDDGDRLSVRRKPRNGELEGGFQIEREPPVARSTT
jgi:hypothetical protein